jgi:hypothetical protein
MIDYLDTHHWVRNGAQGDAGLRSVLPRLRDLRRAPRTAVSAEAVLVPLDQQVRIAEPVSVTLRDVSRFGLGLVSSRLLEPGSQWRVEFLADARRLGEHLVSVRHCKSIQSAYLAGVQFCAAPDLLDSLGIDGADAAAA